jgi:hypothetical protein
MDKHLRRALADAEISGFVAEQHDLADDIDAVRDVEKAVMSLKDRCDRAVRLGCTIAVRTTDGMTAEGICVDAGAEYIVLGHRSTTREVFAVAHIIEVRGLPEALADAPDDRPKPTTSLRTVLRGIDTPCRIRRIDGVHLTGQIAAVSSDHIDVHAADSRRCVVPLAAVVSVWWTH